MSSAPHMASVRPIRRSAAFCAGKLRAMHAAARAMQARCSRYFSATTSSARRGVITAYRSQRRSSLAMVIRGRASARAMV